MGRSMIFRRATAKLRAQDWTAITIELLIVIIGVFIGIWVANWNQERAQKHETRQMLLQLMPELSGLEGFSKNARNYYASTGRYATIAFAGWAGDPKISDEQFVIAAYQASQIYGFNNDGASWALIFGANDLRNIEDRGIREPLTRLMTFDYSTLNFPAVQTRYRDEVRQFIPDEIQQQIRATCGDRINSDRRSYSLIVPCNLRLAPDQASATAFELRQHPELVRLLRQHRATIAAYLINLSLFDGQRKLLVDRISTLES